jgi:hypothetical protein
MDVTEFEALLDGLGEDLSRWPDPQREAAFGLLSQSTAARALLAEANLLRSALARPAVRAPAGLADRIVARATQSESTPAASAEDSAATVKSPKRG